MTTTATTQRRAGVVLGGFVRLRGWNLHRDNVVSFDGREVPLVGLMPDVLQQLVAAEGEPVALADLVELFPGADEMQVRGVLTRLRQRLRKLLDLDDETEVITMDGRGGVRLVV